MMKICMDLGEGPGLKLEKLSQKDQVRQEEITRDFRISNMIFVTFREKLKLERNGQTHTPVGCNLKESKK